MIADLLPSPTREGMGSWFAAEMLSSNHGVCAQYWTQKAPSEPSPRQELGLVTVCPHVSRVTCPVKTSGSYPFPLRAYLLESCSHSSDYFVTRLKCLASLQSYLRRSYQWGMISVKARTSCGDLGVSRASPGPEQLVLTVPQRWVVMTAGESSVARPPLPISASTRTPLPAVRDGSVSAAPDLGLCSDPRQVPRPQRSAAAGSSHGSSSWGKRPSASPERPFLHPPTLSSVSRREEPGAWRQTCVFLVLTGKRWWVFGPFMSEDRWVCERRGPVAQPPSLSLLIALYLLSLQAGDTQDLHGVLTQRLSKSRLICGARQENVTIVWCL